MVKEDRGSVVGRHGGWRHHGGATRIAKWVAGIAREGGVENGGSVAGRHGGSSIVVGGGTAGGRWIREVERR